MRGIKYNEMVINLFRNENKGDNTTLLDANKN